MLSRFKGKIACYDMDLIFNDTNYPGYELLSELMMRAALHFFTSTGKPSDPGGTVWKQWSNEEGVTVEAVQNHNYDIVDVLLKAGAKLTGDGSRGKGILSLASTCGNPEIVSLIKEAAQSAADDEDHSFRNQYRDLRKALEKNQFEDFKKMIQIGILPDSTSDHGNTLIQLFCMNSLSRVIRMDVLPVAEFLIDNGADINAVNNSGYNALYYARSGNQKTMEDILISSGAKE